MECVIETKAGTICREFGDLLHHPIIKCITLHGTPHELIVPMQIHIDRTSCTAKTHFPVP